MKIPPYWVKKSQKMKDAHGQSHSITASGWSFVSPAEAAKEATARAGRIFNRLMGGERPDHYEYHDMPVKEEILGEIFDGEKQLAVITRNRYGAEILNCSQVLFVDVDFPKAESAGFMEWLRRLFFGRSIGEKKEAPAEKAIASVKEWSRQNPDYGFRLYRTKEGLRLLFTGKLFAPASEETERILKGLNADPLYQVLTRKQECFRARLTSKPWRCGSPKPPSSFPWEDEAKEREYRSWQEIYRQKDEGFRICDFIGDFGKKEVLSQAIKIMEIHDRAVRLTGTAPLA
ncbi:hypothetical protein [Desulfobotulus mexicanus]|uniref:Uncharacterized protein n=1 Tax=Desulfobotulus mexicanus TaxID=2586642 RepID=A0A5Q4VDX8_9BACT|nr:hypothetical protein [Desulfobotulus mexicanus]TYT75148.1 hypothetical protein FIM25_05385 [Desulfobotulus mexicanus]